MARRARVLALVSMSRSGRAVVEHACSLCETLGSELDVLHVIEAAPLCSGSARRRELQSELFRLLYRGSELRRTLDTVSSPVAREARLAIEVGELCRTVERVARDGGYAILVLGVPGDPALTLPRRLATTPARLVFVSRGAPGRVAAAPGAETWLGPEGSP